MKNNLGYGKFEVIIIIVVLLFIGAFLAYTILDSSQPQRFSVMRKDAYSFAEVVIINLDDSEKESVTLAEAVDEGLIGHVKNPFAEGECDMYESKIEISKDSKYLTFKCGDYIINKANIRENKYDIYKVTKWHEDATDKNSKSEKVYNCTGDDGKLLFDDYLDANSFIYALRKTYNVDINSIGDAKKSCDVIEKNMYRDYELVDKQE